MIVRIINATIQNFKNIEKGNIRLISENDLLSKRAAIMGIYGQNGSGKTGFIKAIQVLKCMLLGRTLPKDTFNYIMRGQENTSLEYEFLLTSATEVYRVKYTFSISRAREELTNEEDGDSISTDTFVVSDERLQYKKLESDKWTKYTDLFQFHITQKEEIFSPKKRYEAYVDNDAELKNAYQLAKMMSGLKKTSFLFSSSLKKLFVKNESFLKDDFGKIYHELQTFARINLFVIENSSIGLINANVGLPFSFRMKESDSRYSIGNIVIRLEKQTTIPSDAYDVMNRVIEQINIVLDKVIPGLQIRLEKIGKQLLEDGSEGTIVELLSVRGGNSLPLRYESDGIKKIISIMHLLIAVYNYPTSVLAIDELDSGIFEYLLGEIIKIISETGKGQLIFTSHNLRPLEVLDKKNIRLTTTNAKNRYIRFRNLGNNNNMRNVYFRDIVLGGQQEDIYEKTNEFDISMAFRMVADIDGET